MKGKPGATSKMSREHAVETVDPGFTTIVGGKYTTYRVMAQDVVDMAIDDLPRSVGPSRTAELPLLETSYWSYRSKELAESSSTMALWEINKISGTPQPSGEYHHLELTVIELTKSWKSYAHVFTMGSFAFSRFNKNI